MRNPFDKEGNELTLKDVLGTEEDIVTKGIEEQDLKKTKYKPNFKFLNVEHLLQCIKE